MKEFFENNADIILIAFFLFLAIDWLLDRKLKYIKDILWKMECRQKGLDPDE
jgi:hypothetical protein